MAYARRTRSDRAGLVIPVGRIHRMLRKECKTKRINAIAPIYLAGMIQHLVEEFLELASQAAEEQNKTRITPKHLLWAVCHDDKLGYPLSGVIIPQGGFVPAIN